MGPLDEEWVPLSAPGLFYFADVCAGPGGFTEYILWKKGWNAHGFGMTLKGDCDFRWDLLPSLWGGWEAGGDWRLDNFLAAPSQMFETFYGLDGEGGEGNGDITLPRNLDAFEKFVRDSTEDGEGVHLFMADGVRVEKEEEGKEKEGVLQGFSVAGQENLQEVLSKRIYLCQFLCGLSILRPGPPTHPLLHLKSQE